MCISPTGTRRGILLLALALLSSVAACKRESNDRVGVSGQVLLDGKPLPQGAIVFAPIGETPGPRAAGEIRDGRYEIPAADGPSVGWLKVQVWGNDESQVPDIKQTNQVVATPVPPQFNEQSTLTVETNLNSENRFDFDLRGSKSTKPPIRR
jgi:hypothetical protein